MKKLITLIAALCMALPAIAAPKKTDKDKEKDKKAAKEVPAMMWTVVVEGATGETAAEVVKTYLATMKGVNVESSEIKEKVVEAVISSKTKVSRSDVSKALKENKELKLKDFKTKRPDKEDGKKDDAKKEEPKKEEPKKTEEAKPDAKPAGKPATKPDAAADKEMKPEEKKPGVK